MSRVASSERELKLSVTPSFELPGLDGLGDGVVPVPRDPELLSTVYFDTEDLRLARWGVSVRHRLGQGWTVKLPPERQDSMLVRPELVFGGAARRPPAAASDLVRGFTRGAPLEPKTRLRTQRRRVELRDGTGRLVAHVFDDAVSVRGGEAAEDAFREVEVEIDDATSEELLEELVARLHTAGANGGDPTPKYLRSLGAVDLAPVVEVLEIGPDATAGDLVRRALATSVVRLVVHDPVIRLDDDPEGVHQARVATRRLRSDLRTFRTLVDTARADALRNELKWLGGVLGTVRDRDVLLEHLRDVAVEDLAEAHRRGAAELLASLELERDAHHVALLDALRGARYLRLLDLLVAAARSLPLLDDAAFPARDIGPSLARRPWRALAKHVSRLGKKADRGELHEARILAKRARYAADAVAPAVGEPAKAFARAAADLQDVLGDVNDAFVAEARLHAWAETATESGAAAAAALAELERERAKRRRKEWRRAWKALSAPELRAWM